MVYFNYTIGDIYLSQLYILQWHASAPICKINYVNVQNNFVHMQHNYVNSGAIMLILDLDYVTCQYINNVAVNINKSYVNIIMLHDDIIYLAVRGHKYATIHYTC